MKLIRRDMAIGLLRLLKGSSNLADTLCKWPSLHSTKSPEDIQFLC